MWKSLHVKWIWSFFQPVKSIKSISTCHVPRPILKSNGLWYCSASACSSPSLGGVLKIPAKCVATRRRRDFESLNSIPAWENKKISPFRHFVFFSSFHFSAIFQAYFQEHSFWLRMLINSCCHLQVISQYHVLGKLHCIRVSTEASLQIQYHFLWTSL